MNRNNRDYRGRDDRGNYKSSACKIVNKDGARYVTGWNMSKSRGLITLFAAATSKTKQVKSKNGKTWSNLMVKIYSHRTMQTSTYSGMFCHETEKLIIQDIQMVANPRTPSGRTRGGKTVSGYFGKVGR